MAHKIAILGGTFDPIHYGHLRLGEVIREQWDADHILFVPNGQPPHKRGVQASQVDRLQMCRLATASTTYFSVSEVEMIEEGYYYTHDTLQKLSLEWSRSDIGLIIGSDEALKFMEWRYPEKITDLVELLIIERPPYIVSERQLRQELPENASFKIFPEVDFPISSSMVRDKLYNNDSIRFLVPEIVDDYIMENKVYG